MFNLIQKVGKFEQFWVDQTKCYDIEKKMLNLVQKACPDESGDCFVESGIGEDDGRVLAAQLEAQTFHLWSWKQ